MNKFQPISVAEMLTLLEDKSVKLLDCRDMKDYRIGHIEGAMCLHEGLRESMLKSGDKEQKIIIYCYFGHASEHVAEMFTDFGFKQVFSLQGGFSSWKETQAVVV